MKDNQPIMTLVLPLTNVYHTDNILNVILVWHETAAQPKLATYLH